MILLLGGTSETAPLVVALQREGLEVLVSTATDASLELPARRRCGRLDARGMADLCAAEGICLLVDAGHPFAMELHETCRAAAALAGIPMLRFVRGTLTLPSNAIQVSSHEEAARRAFAVGGPVLLTTGSRHLAPYVVQARVGGLPILARVLDHPESLDACRAAGLESHEIEAGRGPYSLNENRALIRRHVARALVTKDSGEGGGLDAKLEAARLEGCTVIVVKRPETVVNGFDDPGRLALAAADLCRS